MILKLLATGLGLVAILMTNSAQALAQNTDLGSSVSIAPFLQQLTIDSSESSKEFELTISNNSKSNQTFSLSPVNFGSLNDTGGIVFEGASNVRINSYGLADWIVIDQESVSLEAGQQTNVKVSINNAPNLAPGAHYAAVIVSGSGANQAAPQLSLKPQVSSLIFLTKLGGERYNIHLSSIATNGSLWSPANKVTLRLSSTGNTFIIPRGIVNLKQNGIVKSKGVINQQSSIVLPKTTRTFDVSLNQTKEISSGLLFKKYQVKVDYRYDGTERYATKIINLTIVNKFTVYFIIALIIVTLIYKRLFHDNLKFRKYMKSIGKPRSKNK